jgi:hypothetical protein
VTQQGYPFFAGHLDLLQEVDVPSGWKRAILEIEGLQAVVADVSINGTDVGNLAWAPHKLDVSLPLKPGLNRVGIRLVNSLHNLLGPWHDPRGEITVHVHWGEWRNAGTWTDQYYFKPLGLEGVKLVLLK